VAPTEHIMTPAMPRKSHLLIFIPGYSRRKILDVLFELESYGLFLYDNSYLIVSNFSIREELAISGFAEPLDFFMT